MRKIPVGILGATGMVGQRFITLLNNHPWFEVVVVAASPNSANKRYEKAVVNRWVMKKGIPSKIAKLNVYEVVAEMNKITKQIDLVFCALEMEKEKIREIENAYASYGIPVVSNNSAHRWTEDVPMIMPEINLQHLELIRYQQKNHGWTTGFVVVKPNCSIQSYVPMITPLLKYGVSRVVVTTLQAVSGAGKTMVSWPEMVENIIPYIGGEEEKSEKEPLRIWGEIKEGSINLSSGIDISATCIRVPVQDGHMASVSIEFDSRVSREQILKEWRNFSPLKDLGLPSSPDPFITIMDDEDRPQTRLDRDLIQGMGISVGRLREDGQRGYKFIGLSHNTIRGAAGGAILTAELLRKKGFLNGKN